MHFTTVGSADGEPDVIVYPEVRIDPATGDNMGEIIPGVAIYSIEFAR